MRQSTVLSHFAPSCKVLAAGLPAPVMPADHLFRHPVAIPQAYLELAKRVDEAIQFMNACGLGAETPIMRETEFYVSHEALLLDYEEALTRQDSTTGLWCAGFRLNPISVLTLQTSSCNKVPAL